MGVFVNVFRVINFKKKNGGLGRTSAVWKVLETYSNEDQLNGLELPFDPQDQHSILAYLRKSYPAFDELNNNILLSYKVWENSHVKDDKGNVIKKNPCYFPRDDDFNGLQPLWKYGRIDKGKSFLDPQGIEE